MDATFVEAPRQRNTPDERKDIKNGKVPEEWKKPENANKLRQKDTDARWTRKAGQLHYGYKNHIKADKDSKLIVDYETTSASVHDSQVIGDLIDENDQVLYADSAYWGSTVASKLPEHVENQIQVRGTKHITITPEQREENRIKSKTRIRAEHVFGFITNSMHSQNLR